ncbi:MAG: hypothetical protein ACKO8C_01145, partial [Candidatus Nanopelagicaceae bacterium]
MLKAPAIGLKFRFSRRTIVIIISLLLGSLALTFINASNSVAIKTIEENIPGASVTIDTTLFLPEQLPAPAILIAHGFGGNKNSERDFAEQ